MKITSQKLSILVFIISYLYHLKRNDPTKFLFITIALRDDRTPLSTILDRLANYRGGPILNQDNTTSTRADLLRTWSNSFC